MTRFKYRPRAFTLVELIIVMLILSILSAIVIPRYSNAKSEAVETALKGNVHIVRKRLQIYADQNGAYPADIDVNWFAERRVPEHPENSFGIPDVQVLAFAGLPHPISKVLKAGVTGAYWYNPTEGTFQARVVDQGTEAATLDFYNEVNGSSETTLGNYGGGGGS